MANTLCDSGLKVASRFFPDGLLTGQPLVTSRVTVTGQPPVSGRVKVTQRGDGAEERGFNADDVNKVEIFLDSALQDKSFGSEHTQTTLTQPTPITDTITRQDLAVNVIVC